MSMVDALIVVAFIAYAVSAGFRNRRQASKNLEEYFLAGRTLPGWKAGLSMAATQFAADTPLLVTGIVATAGIFGLWQLWIFAATFLLMGFVLAGAWRRAGVVTDAELSEVRYGGTPAAVLRGVKAVYVGTVINCPVSKPGMTVAVFGCGGVGLNVIQGARLVNASRIIAVDVWDHKLEFAYKFGATDVVNARAGDPVEAINEIIEGGVDMAFDSFGSPETTSNAVKSVRRAGTAVMIGLGAVGASPHINMVDFLRGQKSLLASYYGMASPHETFGKLIDFYTQGNLDVDSLITRKYALDGINQGFEALAAGEDGRGLVVFD